MKPWQRRLAWFVGIAAVVLVVGAGSLWWYISMWRQEPDLDFDTSVASPAYVGNGPSVAFDGAHLNAHGLTTTYAPFGALLQHDGYLITETASPFSQETLEGHAILVVVNARGSDQAGRRGEPAFTSAEVAAVFEWVLAGGSLLLVADHSPFGSASRDLAQGFGVEMSDMDTVDPVHHDSVSGTDGFLMFSRQNGLLGRHAITEGRQAGERINRVITFNGQSLSGPSEAASLLILSETAVDRAPDGRLYSAQDRSQGLALEVGSGRVVVLAEAALLTAQVAQTPFKKPFRAGMNRTDADNKAFALNIMRWLSRTLNEP